MKKIRKFHIPSIAGLLRSLGPGLVTGASDDDPSGIATYSQVGAKFGLGMLWMALFQLPMMIAVQEICARIGLVTGKGLATIIKNRYSKNIVYPISGLLIVANTINIGADIGAMGASIRGITNGIFSNIAGWITFAIMAISVGLLFFTWLHG